MPQCSCTSYNVSTRQHRQNMERTLLKKSKDKLQEARHWSAGWDVFPTQLAPCHSKGYVNY